jgi:type III pantothenate kinase
MLLAVDIGNTNSSFGIFENEKLLRKFQLPTPRLLFEKSTLDFIGEEISQPNLARRKIKGVCVSSVVPTANEAIRSLSRELFDVDVFFVTPDLDLGLKIKYANPATLGSDRFVDAFAATEKYGAPIIVCDFGTATTIDAINSRREFLGGTITPGIITLAHSLYEKTSQLPNIRIVKRETIFGDSTEHSIQSGIYFGYIGLVESIISRMIEELNEKPQVVATGGSAKFIANSTKLIDIVDQDLMLDGLRLINEKRRASG